MTAAHLDGFHYVPRIDKEMLAARSEGLIGLSGVSQAKSTTRFRQITSRKQNRAPPNIGISSARKISSWNCTITGWKSKKCAIPRRCRLPRDLGVGLVAANDVHFLRRSDHEAHDVMLCIGTGKMVQDESRMRYLPELYFKSPDEMRQVFRDFPEAISNTLHIGERCRLDLEFGGSKYPEYPAPAGKTRRANYASFATEACTCLRRTSDGRFGTNSARRLRTWCSGKNRVR